MSFAMDKQFKMWCHSDDYRKWEEAARLSRKSLSRWTRELLNEAAEAKIAAGPAKKKKPSK